MSKATIDAANFREKYCNGSVAFCIPYHRNWYYKSAGASLSPYLWHVEFSDRAVQEVGDGVIIVNLVSGAIAEGGGGTVEERGDFVVATRQWTDGRHVEISAPKALGAAVEFMMNGLEVYQAPEAQ